MSHLLLDTSAFAAHMRGHRGVVDAVSRAQTVGLNVIALGEILRGFHGGARLAPNLALLARFRSSPRFRLLPIDEDTADRYARIVDGLRRAGTPIPTNDCWIAASALQHNREL